MLNNADVLDQIKSFLNINRKQVSIIHLDAIAESIRKCFDEEILVKAFQYLFEFDYSYYRIIKLNSIDPNKFFNSAKYILDIIYYGIDTDYSHCKRIVFDMNFKKRIYEPK